jgi:lipid-binding SYLF domain-containing protein
MRKIYRVTIFAMFLLTFWIQPALCDKKEEVEKKQAAVLKMRDKTLAELYKGKPETEKMIKSAPGYAVFDNAGIHILLLATSRGKGVAVDNKTQENVFMKMKTVGAGPGLGVKDYQVIFSFDSPASLKKFVEAGWSFTGEADAAAKTKKEGAAAGGLETSGNGFRIYTITKRGVALQATLGGTKFSRDDDLNQQE